MIKCGRHSKCW